MKRSHHGGRTALLLTSVLCAGGCVAATPETPGEPKLETATHALSEEQCRTRATDLQDACLGDCRATFDADVAGIEHDAGAALDAMEDALDAYRTSSYGSCVSMYQYAQATEAFEKIRAALQDAGLPGWSAYGNWAEVAAGVTVARIACFLDPSSWDDHLAYVRAKWELGTQVAEVLWRLLWAGASGLYCNAGCGTTYNNEYRACRGECPGELGQSCVPSGFPEWVDCGTWSRGLFGAGSCGCDAGWGWWTTCAKFDGARSDRLYGTPCDERPDVFELRTFVVDHDASGRPIGGSVRCVPINSEGMPDVGNTGLTPAEADHVVLHREGNLARNEIAEFIVRVPDGATSLSFAMAAGSGDPDLYVRQDAPPSLTEWDCRPYEGANVSESCDFDGLASGTPLHVWVRGFTPSSYDLRITWR